MNLLLKKSLLISLLASQLISDSTFSTNINPNRSTRLDSMVVNNYMTKDGFNMFFNPAYVASMQTSAFLELGLKANGGAAVTNNATLAAGPNAMAGSVFNFGDMGNFGIVLNRTNNVGLAFNMTTTTNNNNVDFFYGLALDDDLKIGARLTYATLENSLSTSNNAYRVKTDVKTYNQNSETLASTSNEQIASDITLELGAQMSGFDVTLTYGKYNYEGSTTGIKNATATTISHFKTTTFNGTAADSNVTNVLYSNDISKAEGDSSGLLEVALEYRLELDEKNSVRGYGMYQSLSSSVKSTNSLTTNNTNYDGTTETTNDSDIVNNNISSLAQSVTISNTTDTLIMGGAYNLKPVENLLFIVAAEYTHTKNEQTTSTLTTQSRVVTQVLTTVTTTDGATGNLTPSTNIITTTDDISIVLAAEAYATESLALRFGLRESIYFDTETNTKNENNGVVYNNGTSQTGVNEATTTNMTANDIQRAMQLGVGFGYQATEAISIDGLMNAAFLLNGPNFISGVATANLNARLAFNYNF